MPRPPAPLSRRPAEATEGQLFPSPARRSSLPPFEGNLRPVTGTTHLLLLLLTLFRSRPEVFSWFFFFATPHLQQSEGVWGKKEEQRRENSLHPGRVDERGCGR